jgi:hypothetical protein
LSVAGVTVEARRFLGFLRRLAWMAARLPAMVRGLGRMEAAERGVHLRFAATLLIVELLIRWVPIAKLAHLLGVRLETGPGRFVEDAVPPSSGVGAEGRVREVIDARARIMRYWPLGGGPCLRESLVVGRLLRDEGACVRLGVARFGGRLRAHAWVELAGQELTERGRFSDSWTVARARS